MSAPQLALHQVCKTYRGGAEALRSVTVDIHKGEMVMVLGPSGSGKSTLLRTINRLIEPTSGRITLEEEEVTAASARRLRRLRRRVGMIFQEFNLVDRASVLTNVLCGRLGATPAWWAWLNRFSPEDLKDAMRHLARLGLEGKWDQRADRLSGGQRQRVGIARALMQRPHVLLADEPVSSLDPAAARSILDLLQAINRQDGVTVICNLHLPDLARRYAGRVLGLRAGTLVYDGPPNGLDAGVLERLYGPGSPA